MRLFILIFCLGFVLSACEPEPEPPEEMNLDGKYLITALIEHANMDFSPAEIVISQFYAAKVTDAYTWENRRNYYNHVFDHVVIEMASRYSYLCQVKHRPVTTAQVFIQAGEKRYEFPHASYGVYKNASLKKDLGTLDTLRLTVVIAADTFVAKTKVLQYVNPNFPDTMILDCKRSWGPNPPADSNNYNWGNVFIDASKPNCRFTPTWNERTRRLWFKFNDETDYMMYGLAGNHQLPYHERSDFHRIGGIQVWQSHRSTKKSVATILPPIERWNSDLFLRVISISDVAPDFFQMESDIPWGMTESDDPERDFMIEMAARLRFGKDRKEYFMSGQNIYQLRNGKPWKQFEMAAVGMFDVYGSYYKKARIRFRRPWLSPSMR